MRNEIVQTIIYLTLALLLISIAILIFIYYSRKKVIETLLQKKQLEVDHEKDLAQAIILSQEKERARIARELHDDINSQVNIISLNAGIIRDIGLPDAEKKHILDKLITQCRSITESIRNIAHDLLPPTLEKFGLIYAIEELCYELNTTGKINVLFDCRIQTDYPDKLHSLYVYRIIQELIKNSLVHGKAENIHILFDNDQQHFLCIYTDDGAGFDLDSALKRSGLGLKNTQSRLEYLGGKLSVKQNTPKGVIIRFNF